MEELPQNLNLQKKFFGTYRLITFTIVFLIIVVIILIAYSLFSLQITQFRISIDFFLNMFSYAFALYVLCVINYKKINRVKYIPLVLVCYALYSLGREIYMAVTSYYLPDYINCATYIIMLLLFFALYRKSTGHMQKASYINAVFITFVLLFIFPILLQFIFIKSLSDIDHSISWLIFEFASFVICLVVYRALKYGSFYKNFIIARPKTQIQEI